jgi:hypothetical protein
MSAIEVDASIALPLQSPRATPRAVVSKILYLRQQFTLVLAGSRITSDAFTG